MSVGDSDLRIRPGRIRGTRAAKPKSFINQVLRAAKKSGPTSSLAAAGKRSSSYGRSTFGRGRISFGRNRLFSPARRVVVKARVVRHQGRSFRSAPLTAHLSYLKRDGVTRNSEKAVMFDAGHDRTDDAAFADRCKDDRHHFRFIVSPEDAAEMTDLKAFTRDLARQMEVDLGTRLALGRLDFLESALAFMAGYDIKSFLIAQSLNQIEKAYGPNNAILDNCHVRVSFATNDERTAKRVSDALRTATEMRAMKNYAGHRLNPWLGHLMVSRQETARPLLTPGEVMQLPPTDEIVMVAGTPPIRAKKARYYEDHRFTERVLTPPDPAKSGRSSRTDGWSALTPQAPDAVLLGEIQKAEQDAANSGLRREPELPDHVAIAKEATDPRPAEEFAAVLDDESDDAVRQARILHQQMRGIARQVSLDPNDGMEL